MYPGPAPINYIGTAAQITELIHPYKDDKDKFTTYCKFRIILIFVITNKVPEKYITILKHFITKFCQYEPLTLLTHIYT